MKPRIYANQKRFVDHVKQKKCNELKELFNSYSRVPCFFMDGRPCFLFRLSIISKTGAELSFEQIGIGGFTLNIPLSASSA